MAEPEKTRDVVRFNAFTDGVMVVSMTILILNVNLPENIKDLDGLALAKTLLDIWPHFLGYALSFIVVAQYWMGYTDFFGGLRAVDGGFAWRNILLLLAIGFIPFVTSLLSHNEGWLATSLYAAVMILIAAILIDMGLYALRHDLLARRWPPGEEWREIYPWLQIAAVFGISILIAQFDPGLAKLSWILLAVPNLSTKRT
jgi:uncharacterized membrane protein